MRNYYYYQLHIMYNFEEINKTRYAQMQSSIFNKTGSTIVAGSTISSASKLNLTGKFSLMEDSVRNIEAEAHALTKAAKESQRVLDQMKRVVAQKELNEYRGKCIEEVKKYEKVVTYGIAENDKRTEQMWSRCKALGQSSEELKNIITNLHNRINKLENVLGFYNGAEIVSNY